MRLILSWLRLYIAHPFPLSLCGSGDDLGDGIVGVDGALVESRSKQKYGAIVKLWPLPLFQANSESSCDASIKNSEPNRSFRVRSASLK